MEPWDWKGPPEINAIILRTLEKVALSNSGG